MNGVNKIIIVGNVTKNVEAKHLSSGTTVANFSVAVNESFKTKEGKKIDSVEYFDVVLWHGLAEVAELYVKKGDAIYIEGKQKSSSYEKDGITRYKKELVGEKMTMLGGNKESSNSDEAMKTRAENSKRYAEERAKEQQNNQIPPPTEGDELPF